MCSGSTTTIQQDTNREQQKIIVLRNWLKYLKENQYQSKEKELKEMTK
jgi:hypothetical protein